MGIPLWDRTELQVQTPLRHATGTFQYRTNVSPQMEQCAAAAKPVPRVYLVLAFLAFSASDGMPADFLRSLRMPQMLAEAPVVGVQTGKKVDLNRSLCPIQSDLVEHSIARAAQVVLLA
mmetsp:Transcript_11120/g.25651  ORF Transcript_11120/g.25651 Transcript_11120/m.25651 type:complete len:119 (-) Transcript_11120:65-421(-)